ncbi:MAG: hypothetical protein M5U22_08010 [Thermoleophilia bacterium]|nr:hypothetical protein [Thermoleophilia bacterium]
MALAAIVFAGAVLSGCGNGSTTTTAAPTSDTAAATSGTTAPESEPTETAGGSTIADGEQFGFVREVAAGTLVFDPAEFLTGEAAVAAAREAGVIGEDEDLPNDFFIRNTDTSEETVPVDSAITFTLVGFDSAGALTDEEVSYAELEQLFAGGADTAQVYGFVPGELPMTLTFAGGKVAGGVQQYLP